MTKDKMSKVVELAVIKGMPHKEVCNKLKISRWMLRDFLNRYNLRTKDISPVTFGSKKEPYWDTEWEYGTTFNPFFKLKAKDVEHEKGKTI